jgi:hypothetical protein
MSYAAADATDAELITLGRKLWQGYYPSCPDVFFQVANAARLLGRVALDALMQSLPSAEEHNLAMAFGLAAVVAARREGRPVPDAVLPLLRAGLASVSRLDETILCELLDGPWSRVWPDPVTRPWLLCIGSADLAWERLGAFETVVLAIAADYGEELVNRWQAATAEADRIRYAAALAWGLPLWRAGEVLATLPERSWRERQSLLHALVRHGDALLPALDAALADERTQAIAARVWRELPPSPAVLARTEQVRVLHEDETAERLRTERNAKVGQAKLERTRDPRPTAWLMAQAYLRAGRNFTDAVLAPAQAALDAGDRSGVIAALLLFESVIVTAAAAPAASGFSAPWQRFVERTTAELPGVVHLARALLAFPSRQDIECEGAYAILWAGAMVDDVLVWLIDRDPPPWSLK